MSESTNDVCIIGVHREDRTIVLTDATGQEHTATTPEGLWAALMAIYDNKEIPKTAVPSSNVAEVQGILSIVQTQAQEFATGQYGAIAGALAGTVARNGAKKVLDIMRKHSR